MTARKRIALILAVGALLFSVVIVWNEAETTGRVGLGTLAGALAFSALALVVVGQAVVGASVLRWLLRKMSSR